MSYKFFAELKLTAGFRNILSNTGYLFGEKVFNLILSLFVGIYVARYLGPADFGLWQYANSLVGIFSVVATLGTTQIVIRDLVKKPDEEESILGTSFILMLTSAVLVTALVITYGFVSNPDIITRWLIVIASSNLVLKAFEVFDYWFQAKVLSRYSVYARTAAHISISMLKVVFILLSLSVIYFAATVIVAGVIQAVLWVYYYEKSGKSVRDWEFNSSYAKSLLENTWPLILSGISVAVYMKIDQVMLKDMVSANAVGNYAVAVSVSELWYFIPMAIASSVFPSIISSKKENRDKYYRRMQYLYDVMAGVAVMIAIPMTFISTPLMNFLFGMEYSQAGGVLAIHIWAGIFVFLGVARGNWIINENYQFYGMIFTIIGAVANVFLNLWLIPLIGIEGAAWATVISYMLSAWFMGLLFKKTWVAFYMQGKAMGRVILIMPLYYSIKRFIYEVGEK